MFPSRVAIWPTRQVRQAASTQTTALATKTTPKERSEHFKGNGIWGELKQWMSALSHHKCWYCESKSLRAPCDVDHYRPKLATTSSRRRVVGHDGYYWLAYAWTNFRLSCIRCNRKEKDESRILVGKGNDFALLDESHRCVTETGSIANETPMLLDPCSDSDYLLLAHGLDGEVKPNATQGTTNYDRAKYTITTLGLNSYGVPDQKRKDLRGLLLYIKAADLNETLIPEIQDYLRCYISPDHEYVSFFRSVIGAYRDKDWIEAIL
jgi:uncharacterized protein (TIGR02646 family)